MITAGSLLEEKCCSMNAPSSSTASSGRRERGGDINKELIVEALAYVPNQINRLVFTKGYSPTQSVLGCDPFAEHTASADRLSAAVVSRQERGTDLGDNMENRLRAQSARVPAAAVM